MKVELARKLDYWLGIPLCFFLKIGDILFKKAFYKEKKEFSDKLVFIKLTEMGAIVSALPLIMKIKRKAPQTEIFFLTFRKNLPVFEALNILPVKNVISIREDSLLLFLSDTIRAVKTIRRLKVKTTIDLEFFSRFTAVLTYLSGAEKRAGFYRYSFEGLYRGDLLTHKAQYNPLLHASKAYLSLAGGLGLEGKSTPQMNEAINEEDIVLPELHFSQDDKDKVLNKLEGFKPGQRLFLISPGDGVLPLREWPLENYLKLANMLLEDDNNYVAIVGARECRKKSANLFCEIKNSRSADLSGKTSLKELLALFEAARALIVHDCGLAHLASLTSVKKFIIFGPESPHVFKPLDKNTNVIYSGLPCSPCFSVFNHRSSACCNNRCLKLISPEEVIAKVRAQFSTYVEV